MGLLVKVFAPGRRMTGWVEIRILDQPVLCDKGLSFDARYKLGQGHEICKTKGVALPLLTALLYDHHKSSQPPLVGRLTLSASGSS